MVEARYLFLTPREWLIGVAGAAVAALAVAPYSVWLSYWIPVSVFLFVLTAYHMRPASEFIVPFPHVAILISVLEYVLAAWAGVYYPAIDPIYNIGEGLPYYLSFAGPVLLAVAVGWSLSLTRIVPRIRPQNAPDARLLSEMDILFVVGMCGIVAGRFLQNTPLAFIGVLVGYLRFIGVHGRMVLRAPGWQWRLGVAIGAEVLLAAEVAAFNPLLLWVLWTFCVWLHCFQPRFPIVLVSIVAGLILLPALQEAKWRLRGGLPEIDVETGAAYETLEGEGGTVTRAFDWLRYLGEGVWRTATWQLPDEFLGDTVARYNQGWIIARTMSVVPAIEPYAQGDTLVAAARAAFLPRIIDPDKMEAGGEANLERFSGIHLNESTSMNLGYAGEMYANFGSTGGAIACGFYALFFGLLFRTIYRRAISHPLWWSLVPFIFFAALKGDDGIAEVLNWTVKSAVVAAGIVLLLPNFRHALFGGNIGRQAATPMTSP